MRLLLFLAVVATFVYKTLAASRICPEGLQPMFNGACAVRMQHPNKFEYDQAEEICSKMGAYLPSIKSAAENENLRVLAAGKRIYIGLGQHGYGKCMWSDGSKYSYTNYRPGEDTCEQYETIATVLNPEDGKWTLDSGKVMDTIVCTAPPKYNSRCLDFAAVDETSPVCYDYHEEKLTRNKAEATCAKDGATLAVIHDKDLNAFIRRTAVSHGTSTSAHIGLSSINGTFTWADGSKMDYTNFAKGFPLPGLGDCATMQIRQQDGQWMNEPCDTQPLSFACTRPVPQTTSDQCPEAELYKSGDDIRVEVLQFAVNTCCGSLTIYDGVYEDTQLAMLSGEIPYTNYTPTQSSVRFSWNSTELGELPGWHLRVFVE